MATTPEEDPRGDVPPRRSASPGPFSFNGEVESCPISGSRSQLGLWASGLRVVQGVSQRWASVAPEMAQGATGDARSDVFSLGILFREMLIGPRFGADVTDAQAIEHTREGFVPPTFLELQLPAT